MDLQQTIAETVRQDYRTAPVFKSFGLDFCCGGNISISQAAKKNDVDTNELLHALTQATTSTTHAQEYDSWSAQFLAEYIQNTHHTYTRKAIESITPFLEKVVRVHGSAHPELIEVQLVFSGLAEELLDHMQTEEELFSDMSKNDESVLSHLRREHEHAGRALKQIRTLTSDYTPPEYACNTYQVTFKLLADLEEDLHKHIHLENNILFEKLQNTKLRT